MPWEALSEIMDTVHKLDILREVYSEEAELDQILKKLLDVALSRHRDRWKRYEHELRQFEERYGMDSETFYQRFEAGELGDDMDFFEWAGVYELREDIETKVRRLENAL